MGPTATKAVDVEHIVHPVLPAGEDSSKCGAYSIRIRLVQFDEKVDVAFVVAIPLGIQGGYVQDRRIELASMK